MSHQNVRIQNSMWKRCKRKASKYVEHLFDDDDDPIQLVDVTDCNNDFITSAKHPALDNSYLSLLTPIDQVPHCAGTGTSEASFEQEDHSCEVQSLYLEEGEEEEEDLFYDCDHHENDIDFDNDLDNDLGHPFAPQELSDLRSLFNDPEDCNHGSELKSDLILWSLEYKIGRNALTGLLHILRKHNHPHLPSSSKTLLKTPRSTVKMFKRLGTGLFWYYGILVNLIPRLTEKKLSTLNGNVIEIDIFADGVTPYKSVKTVLWPICGCMKDIFIIAGVGSQSNLALFLEDLIREANELMSGFTDLGYHLKLVIRNLIADAPARTWLKNRYHKGPTPLMELSDFSLISQMPLEPMHLLSLGVMKRILLQLLAVKRNNCRYKFSEPLKLTIGSLSEYISLFYPFEFARKPRKWTEYTLLKATEFRRIPLYDGFTIFKTKGVSQKVYHNYLLLATAIRILSDPMLVRDFNDDADTLLKKFVTNSVSVYGQLFNVYNVHHLKHLAEE
ncbi:hypothetical protein FOCC_FOCC004065, partial [Frankliniella occidentalis]